MPDDNLQQINTFIFGYAASISWYYYLEDDVGYYSSQAMGTGLALPTSLDLDGFSFDPLQYVYNFASMPPSGTTLLENSAASVSASTSVPNDSTAVDYPGLGPQGVQYLDSSALNSQVGAISSQSSAEIQDPATGYPGNAYRGVGGATVNQSNSSITQTCRMYRSAPAS